MYRKKPIALIGGALVCGLSSLALAEAPASGNATADVAAELAALKAEVAQLRTQTSQSWLTERRAEEVKTLVKEVLADADTRASLAGSTMTGGFNGKNFILTNEEGTFLLKMTGQLQLRYVTSFRRHDAVAVGKEQANTSWEDGFQIRRAKVGFEGFIGNPKIEFKILMAADRDTTGVNTEDLWVAYTVMDGVRVWGGRFQDRFGRESQMSSKTQMTVDRSAVANIYAANDDFVEGIGVEWAAMPDLLKLAATMNDGLNGGTAGGTGAAVGFGNGGSDFNNTAADIAFTGRADVKLAGEWAQAGDVESWSSTSGLQAFVGAGVHYEVGKTGDKNTSANSTNSGPYNSFTQWTVDGLVKYKGLGVMGAVYGWHIDSSNAAALIGSATTGAIAPKGDTNNYAATVQVGYMVIPDKLEPFVRYEWLNWDNKYATNDLNLLTFGFNYFLAKHNAKFTADVVWALDNINAQNTLATSLSGIGLLSDAAGKNGQFVGRLQFQLLF